MLALEFAVIVLAGASLAILLNLIGIIAYRKTVGAHWTERARVLYPARLAAKTYILFLPVIVVALLRLTWPAASDHVFIELAVALCGVLLGTWFFDSEVVPWLTWKIWWQEVVLGWGIRAVRWSVYVVAISQIGPHWRWQSALIAGGVIVFDLWMGLGGLMRLFRALGQVPDAPERVRAIVSEVCQRMKVPMPAVWSSPSSMCNAMALIWIRALLFTDVLIERLSDAELRGIAAHEVAHLDESRATRVFRVAAFLAVWPWLFIRSLIGVLGAAGIFTLLGWWWFVRYAMVALARRMELRADRAAVEMDETQKAEYAAGLARIYEVSLMPAVMPNGRQTHPHLYDRMLAAGVTPDFPRPAASEKYSTTSFLVSVAFGLLAVTQFKDVLLAIGDWIERA